MKRQRFMVITAPMDPIVPYFNPERETPSKKTPGGRGNPVPSGDRREPRPREEKVFGLALQGRSLIKKHPRAGETPVPTGDRREPHPREEKVFGLALQGRSRSNNIRGQGKPPSPQVTEGSPAPGKKSLWPALTGQIPDQKIPAGRGNPVPSGDRREPRPREEKVFGLPFFRKVGSREKYETVEEICRCVSGSSMYDNSMWPFGAGGRV